MEAQEIAELKNKIDLLSLVGHDTQLRHVSSTRGGEWAGACPFCGGHDRLRVQVERGLWWCRQCSPTEHWADAIEYVQRRDAVDFVEAVMRLSNGAIGTDFAPAKPAGRKPTALQSSDWQPAAREVMQHCAAALWSDMPLARGALAWLNERGLNTDTLKAWSIGFNPQRRKIAGLWVENGVTIPYIAGAELYAINVRLPNAYLRLNPKADKYRLVTGSRRVLFGCDHLTGKPDVLITEGEFDALLAWQEAREHIDVLTMGAAKDLPAGTWLAYLLSGQRFYIATDTDEPGNAAAAKWAGLLGERGQRAAVPTGKDITEYWQSGGDVRAWVVGLLPVKDDRHIVEQPVIDDGVSVRAADDWLNLMPDDEPAAAMPDEIAPVLDAEQKLLALFDQWEQADDQADQKWRERWSLLAIEAGAACYEVHHTEMGEVVQVNAWPGGWQRWAAA
jgi:DNA primase